MKRILKRTLAMLLCLIMVFPMCTTALAAGETQTGSCGENATYTLKDGVLTVEGTGVISSKAFIGNWDIKKLIIKEGITGIESSAFENCGAMVSAVFPDSLSIIRGHAFSRCIGLREMTVGNNDRFTILDYGIEYCKDLHITFPCAIKYAFQSRAFYYSTVVATVPDSWTPNEMRGYYASSITYIGGWAQNGNLQISQRELGKWEIRGEGAIADGTFSGRNDIVQVTVDDGITSVGSKAFENCAELTQVKLGSTVSSIGSNAFTGCGKLRSVTGNTGLETIGEKAFKGCSSLESFAFGTVLTKMEQYAFAGSGLVSVELPGTLKEIPYCAFDGCKNLRSASVGEGTEILGDFAFSCCALTSVTLPDSIRSIGHAAFIQDKLTEIKCPASLKTIGASAFKECRNLKKVVFNDALRTVDKEAFLACGSLTEVQFNEGLEKLGDYCFENSDLQKAELPSTLKEIGGYCFYGLDDLTSMIIPASVTRMGKNVFKGSTRLSAITCLAAVPPKADPDLFSGSSVKTVYVPALSTMAYHQAAGWSVTEQIALFDREILDPASDGTYQIGNAEDLAVFLLSIAKGSTYSGKTVILANDISLSEVSHKAIWTDSVRKNAFKGHFDGKGHTISDLTIESSDHRSGLFRTVGGGAFIENLILDNVSISGSKDCCGALIGYASDTVTVNNVTVRSGSISGCNYVGGIVGEIGGSKLFTATSCTNGADVSASGKDAGGILACSGTSAGVKLDKCENNGSVSSKSGRAGGIAGYLGNNSDDPVHTVQNCRNSGAITSETSDAGGIVGGLCTDNKSHSIAGNRNSGVITGVKSVGGIIGWMEGGGSFIDDTNTANVTATGDSSKSGGIVGHIEDDKCSFTGCTSTGTVRGTKHASVCGWDGYSKKSIGDSESFLASFFGSGNVIVIAALSVLLIAAAILIRRKMKKVTK